MDLPALDFSTNENLARSIKARRDACTHPSQAWGYNKLGQPECSDCGQALFDLPQFSLAAFFEATKNGRGHAAEAV
jgi:hypothetical protein